MITRLPRVLVIKSDITELSKVEDFLVEIFKEYKLEKKYFNRIYLCITEAVINAIKHGNKGNFGKNVTLIIRYFPDEIYIEIEDEGEGFDFSEVKDPTLKENINKESGRGIFIIKNLSNTMEYNDKGNLVRLKIECK